MKTRIVTAIIYAIAIIALMLIKLALLPYAVWQWVPIDLLFWFCSVVGTYEMLRAMGNVAASQKTLVTAYSFVLVPFFFVIESLGGDGLHLAMLLTVLFIAAILAVMVVEYDETSLESTKSALLSLAYPNLFFLFAVMINHLQSNAYIGLLFVFLVCHLTDVAAFCFGMGLRDKFPQKLAPKVSPNKSVVGAIGGLAGGMLSAVIVGIIAWIFPSIVVVNVTAIPTWLMMLIIGVVASALTEFGDLVESAIKRKVGIKDMGNLLPGHGGVLDRFDGNLFASVFIYLLLTVMI